MTTRPAAPRPITRRPAPLVGWALGALAVLGLVPVVWLDHLLREASRPDLLLLKPSDLPFTLATLSAATVGAVLSTRQPRHPVGWLLLALGLSVPAAGIIQGYARYGLLARPGVLPAADLVAAHTVTFPVAWLVCIALILLLTPSGSLPSPRWRLPAWVAATAPAVFMASQTLGVEPLDPTYRSVVNPLAIPAFAGPLRIAAAAAAGIASLTLVAAAISMLLRYRRARGVHRQQLRWLAMAAIGAAAAATVVIVAVPSDVTGSTGMLNLAVGAYVALLPLAIGAAILRYRLYDLDRIISRTIAYTLLTALLGAGYAAVALALGQLLGGQRSGLAVAGATLTVAAAFHPARRRVQELVDRRFDRRRYDAAHTIEAFSIRLRQQLDLETLTGELLTVVDQTMQPTHIALWVRPPHDHDSDRPTHVAATHPRP